jgi:curved DNA-binding protein CbpA/LysM repeat protein
MPDYYEILGLTHEADTEEIKSAFHRLAKISHPDLNAGDATAESRFKKFNQAYETLSDSEKRAAYDLELRGGPRVFRHTAVSRGSATKSSTNANHSPSSRQRWQVVATGIFSGLILGLVVAPAVLWLSHNPVNSQKAKSPVGLTTAKEIPDHEAPTGSLQAAQEPIARGSYDQGTALAPLRVVDPASDDVRASLPAQPAYSPTGEHNASLQRDYSSSPFANEASAAERLANKLLAPEPTIPQGAPQQSAAPPVVVNPPAPFSVLAAPPLQAGRNTIPPDAGTVAFAPSMQLLSQHDDGLGQATGRFEHGDVAGASVAYKPWSAPSHCGGVETQVGNESRCLEIAGLTVGWQQAALPKVPVPKIHIPASGPLSAKPLTQAPHGWEGRYTIRSDDSFYAIAHQHKVSISDLQRANDISDPTKVRAGTILQVPGNAEPVEATPDQMKAALQGWVGASVLDVSKPEADRRGWDPPHGAKLGLVAPGSPAEKAGLKSGDIILAIDHVFVETSSDVDAAIAAKRPGDELRLLVLAGGRERRATLSLGERPTSKLLERSSPPDRGNQPPRILPSGETIQVQQGDSLYGIAKRHGVPLSALIEVNGLKHGSTMKAGQELKLPADAVK